VKTLQKEDGERRGRKQAVRPEKKRYDLALMIDLRLRGRDVAPFLGRKNLRGAEGSAVA